ncbi:MAG: hypothetical protein J6J71_03710 [Prevotella sp.]|nr:hypothetical protein [Alistipes sp.]MBP3573696.1 hypothetical protein [Prevotella sp.]
MAQRGRKKGCTDEEAYHLRLRLFEEYDRLMALEKVEDATRASFLPRGYYIEKLFALHIAPWSKSRIRRLLMYRYKRDERK